VPWGGNPAGNLSLAADRIAGEIIDVPSVQRPELKRVDRGNPEGSYLLMKVIGEDIAGQQMPVGGRLADEQIELIRAWIAAGAPEE